MGRILPYNHSLKQNANFLRKNSSKAEILLWTGLRRKQINGLQFHRQRMISNFILDFYCKEIKFGIEVDDKSHDEKYLYDMKRSAVLKNLGVTLFRVSNKDVLENLEGVIVLIKESTKGVKPSP